MLPNYCGKPFGPRPLCTTCKDTQQSNLARVPVASRGAETLCPPLPAYQEVFSVSLFLIRRAVDFRAY